MTNILWVTTDDANMSNEHHKILAEHYAKTGIWIKCFKYNDVTSEAHYNETANGVDVIAFDEHFPLHLLPRIIRKDKECIAAVTISLPSRGGTRDLVRWKRVEKTFTCTMTDVIG